MLLQSFLTTRILGTTPILYSGSRVISVNLLRQYAKASVTKPQETKKKVSNKSASKKGKKKDDVAVVPTEPKRPPTAYSLFYRDFFHQERTKFPEKVDVTVLAKLAGEKWSKLSADEKQVYVEEQKKSADDYVKIHKKWLESLTPAQIAQENRRRKESKSKKSIKLIKDPKKPKKPRTSYINYVVDHIHDDKEKGPDRIKEIATQWKTLSLEEKKPYNEAYQKDKVRYNEEMKLYKENF
ncbi:19801_t:CDS:2 [Funneliformis geosporum]|uniref:7987_t:CDS:1 n=1 Tax=Funneliformis geosporum TaxID=1117311 RepID=A0A9W4T2I4_9GLOM|nr:19801_t:CDS:2 [Funneliformis geosporum]CAI2189685.1 7987_t:CDS:2 [Funneliformis geosporum]